MSDKPKFPHWQALDVAENLVALMKPLCLRIEIAGSIRRQKPMVGDIEILYVPKTKAADLFGGEQESEVEPLLERLLKSGDMTKRPNKLGNFTWGPLNKLAIFGGIPTDLFATTEEKWFTAIVIRTGGKDTNLLLTTGANKLGGSLEAYGEGFRDRYGVVTRATSEEHVFQMCGVPYAPPEKRA